MALMPQPLSWDEKQAMAQRLRKEAAQLIREAERIEKGVEADQKKVMDAIKKARGDWLEKQKNGINQLDLATRAI